ncbi:PREDICTED: vomeronasal type-1 receptor 3-like [Galeopterus variegatus]|uniref:Vomeronasal type-1 receptor n=1 Tax=Galeopterus variegatus TaxID=482537 RepID=A0ABM0SH11_GALVR|nr:PREDICTED: vomeronasal type-1 receptor 3-like [Galeopterus variegatus]
MSSQNNTLKTAGEVALMTIFLFQVWVGTLANVMVFFQNISPILFGLRLRPIQVILTHLAVANSLVLLSIGIPHMMVAFVLRNPLSSLGCKLVYYIHLVARGTTLCSTCVLSICRFLTLIPGRPDRLIFRGRTPKAMGPSCWMFSALMNIYVPMRVTGPQGTHNGTDTEGKWFCSSLSIGVSMVFLQSGHDVIFIGLMVWASGSMIFILQRHHQKVQHIHTTNHYHKCSPETRATHTILMQVVTFVSFYILHSIYAFYIIAFVDSHLCVLHVTKIITSCFPSVSPLLLIFRNPRPFSFRS